MTRLIGAEFRRFLKRRSFRLVGALCIAGVLVGGVIVFANSSHDPHSGLVQAQAAVAQCKAAMRSAPRGAVKANPGNGVFIGSCPSVAEMRLQFDKRFHYATTVPQASRNVAIPLFLLALIVSASFVGAEFGTGMMTTTLTWEPRRGRVLLAKALPSLVITSAAAAVILAFLAVTFIPIGVFRGTTTGMTDTFWHHLSGVWLRSAGLAAFGSVMGLGLATFARNTVAAIGIGFGYFGLFDRILSRLWDRRFAPWLFEQNSERLLRIPIDVVRSQSPIGEPSIRSIFLSSTRPVVLFSIYAAALLVAAYASFRVRDVT